MTQRSARKSWSAPLTSLPARPALLESEPLDSVAGMAGHARSSAAAAPYLSSEFVDANFAFYGTTLSGTPRNKDRWKRGVAVVEAALGEAVGQIYVAGTSPKPQSQDADARRQPDRGLPGEHLRPGLDGRGHQSWRR